MFGTRTFAESRAVLPGNIFTCRSHSLLERSLSPTLEVAKIAETQEYKHDCVHVPYYRCIKPQNKQKHTVRTPPKFKFRVVAGANINL